MKKGKSNRIWRQRFFVLETNLLSYYKPSERVPAGVIPLENCSVTISDESLFKKPFCFVISTRCRNYFVQARDQYEMACWIESIKFHAQEKVDEDMVRPLTCCFVVACFPSLVIPRPWRVRCCVLASLRCVLAASCSFVFAVGECEAVQPPEQCACCAR